VLLENINETKESLFVHTTSRNVEENMNALKRAMGAMQHHDAITGTEKEAVAYDYALRIRYGIYLLYIV
jgi:lysosomal alpha-mannosidase